MSIDQYSDCGLHGTVSPASGGYRRAERNSARLAQQELGALPGGLFPRRGTPTLKRDAPERPAGFRVPEAARPVRYARPLKNVPRIDQRDAVGAEARHPDPGARRQCDRYAETERASADRDGGERGAIGLAQDGDGAAAIVRHPQSRPGEDDAARAVTDRKRAEE